MIERAYTALFPFCGLGGGALGFSRAEATFRSLGLTARFKVLGGIEWDSGTAADFERLTGAPCLVADVRAVTPALLREWFGVEPPDVVFFSPPCKGSSGLLAPAIAATPKYRAMNELAVVWTELMFAAWPEGPRLSLMENVPRIRQRAGDMLAQVRRLHRARGYVFHDEAHDLGKLGGL
jgi:site-specific DNA-cytosine methylase